MFINFIMNKKSLKLKQKRKKAQHDKKIMSDFLTLQTEIMKIDPENSARILFPTSKKQEPVNTAFVDVLDILKL